MRDRSRHRTKAEPMPSSYLSATRHDADLNTLAGPGAGGAGETVDLLVVGGGVTGTGVALDAASRGLSVALVERHDLAAGTSRWSSKLVHGGLRYLARGELGIAHESARERHLLLTRIAPHLVRPLPFVYLVDDALSRTKAAYYRFGLAVADGLRTAAGTSRALLPNARAISLGEARRLTPALAGRGRGAWLQWDGQLYDDAALVVALARTAAAYGTRILTRCAATSVDGGGADVRDERTGAGLRIAARQVVVATGVWTPELAPGVTVRPSRGTHLLVRASALGYPRAGLTVFDPDGEHYVMALPRPDGLVLVGLTDDPLDDAPSETPGPGTGDVDYLLRALSRALSRPIGRSDVVGTTVGLRPLLGAADADAKGTAALSRDYALVTDPATGVHALAVGKLTTYRHMAADAVDRVARALGRDETCRTDALPLVGAAPRSPLGVPGVPTRLVRRYGVEAADVWALAGQDPALAEPVADGVPTLGVELAWELSAEGALDADDLLDRRTRVGLVPAWREAALPAAERLLAGSSAQACA